MILSILNDLLQWSTLLEAKIEAQPKPSSKRIENVSLASFFGRLWGGVHDPVHLKRPFTMEHLNWHFKHSFAARFCIRKGSDENRNPAQTVVKMHRKRSVGVVFW